jgi:hypothetical protein
VGWVGSVLLTGYRLFCFLRCACCLLFLRSCRWGIDLGKVDSTVRCWEFCGQCTEVIGPEQGWNRDSTYEILQLWPYCDRVGADITVLREREVDYDSDVPRKITEVLVRKVPDNQQVSTCPSLPPCSHCLGRPHSVRLFTGPGDWRYPHHLLLTREHHHP